jgi:hypothetical protein
MNSAIPSIGIALAMLMASCGARQGLGTGSMNAAEQTSRATFDGKSGKSFDEAVVISNARDQREGVNAEYRFISMMHGKKGRDWKLKGQTTARENDAVYDIVEIELLESGTTRYYYFDITDCSWKPSY